MGESLKRSSAAMKAANNDLNEVLALTVAANNVLQDPTVVGGALKTVSMDKLVAWYSNVSRKIYSKQGMLSLLLRNREYVDPVLNL